MKKNASVDQSFREAVIWRKESNALRRILLESDLSEELKWGKPCYTHNGRNICIIQRMKGFLALMFFKGSLLRDPDGILEVQGPNSRSGYRARFTSVSDVENLAKSIRRCVRDAIEVERAGLEVSKSGAIDYPDELVTCLARDPEFKAAFERLTPGRKRGYAIYFSDAVQSKTRVARVERSRQKIMDGKGIHDR